MAKNLGKLVATAGLAGAGAAAVAAKKLADAKKAAEKAVDSSPNPYRNTELGRHERNRKGIYYSSGN